MIIVWSDVGEKFEALDGDVEIWRIQIPHLGNCHEISCKRWNNGVIRLIMFYCFQLRRDYVNKK